MVTICRAAPLFASKSLFLIYSCIPFALTIIYLTSFPSFSSTLTLPSSFVLRSTSVFHLVRLKFPTRSTICLFSSAKLLTTSPWSLSAPDALMLLLFGGVSCTGEVDIPLCYPCSCDLILRCSCHLAHVPCADSCFCQYLFLWSYPWPWPRLFAIALCSGPPSVFLILFASQQ